MAFTIDHGSRFNITAFHPRILALTVVPGMGIWAPAVIWRRSHRSRPASHGRYHGRSCWHPGADTADAHAPNVTVVYSLLAVTIAGPVGRIYNDETIIGPGNRIKALLLVFAAGIALIGSVLGASWVDSWTNRNTETEISMVALVAAASG